MIPGVRLVMLGRQGAGKGTQCVRLARHYVVPHISTGDMLRAAVNEGSPLGLKAKELMDGGELVPDDLMVGLVDDRLARGDTRARGFVLDGFPRTVTQGEALTGITAWAPIHLVVDLSVPRDLVLGRLAGRRVCRDCQTNYSLANQPKSDWICDVCGGDVVLRDDDTEEAINRRLDLYETQTRPLIAYYRERGLLVEVDGVGDPADVLERLVLAVDTRSERRRAGV